jgi:hypothetical protein
MSAPGRLSGPSPQHGTNGPSAIGADVRGAPRPTPARVAGLRALPPGTIGWDAASQPLQAALAAAVLQRARALDEERTGEARSPASTAGTELAGRLRKMRRKDETAPLFGNDGPAATAPAVRSSRVDRTRGARLQRCPPAAASAPVATPTIVNLAGPTAGTCRAFEWDVNFALPAASPAGGYFVQEITMRTDATDAGGIVDVDETMAAHFWEAWRVAPGGTLDELVANGSESYTDRYMLPSAPGLKGSFDVTGRVRFYEGLVLPTTFVTQNPATMAGDLPSTAVDPALPGGTPALAHDIAGTWDCCGGSATDATQFTSHTP